MEYRHAPVMVREVLELLSPGPGKTYLDGTLGGGGHAEQLLERSSPDGRLLGLDWDDEAITAAEEKLGRFGDRIIIRRANFRDAKMILQELSWEKVDGILLDLGLSSHHLESANRGFSFQRESPLDMRMDRRRSLDARRIVNTFSIRELERIIRVYGEEPRARQIARAIDAARRHKPIRTTKELAEVAGKAAGKRVHRIHPATRVFQALRIAVNDELQNLRTFLGNGYELLRPRGRMVIIAFHSLEDRLVKEACRTWTRSCLCPPRTPVCRCGWTRKARILTSKPMTPSRKEIERNPRARSARLRAVERL